MQNRSCRLEGACTPFCKGRWGKTEGGGRQQESTSDPALCSTSCSEGPCVVTMQWTVPAGVREHYNLSINASMNLSVGNTLKLQMMCSIEELWKYVQHCPSPHDDIEFCPGFPTQQTPPKILCILLCTRLYANRRSNNRAQSVCTSMSLMTLTPSSTVLAKQEMQSRERQAGTKPWEETLRTVGLIPTHPFSMAGTLPAA